MSTVVPTSNTPSVWVVCGEIAYEGATVFAACATEELAETYRAKYIQEHPDNWYDSISISEIDFVPSAGIFD